MRLMMCRQCLLWIFFSVALAGGCWGQSSGNCTQRDASTRPECPGAIVFFQKLQAEVKADNRQKVAAAVAYPVSIFVKNKRVKLTNRQQFLAHYDDAFNAAVRCAVGKGRESDVWDNYKGFTFDGGVIWWDVIVPAKNASAVLADKDYWKKYPFKIIAINNRDVLMEGCK